MGYLRPTAIIVGASYNTHTEVGGYDFKGRHWIEIAHEQARGIFARRGMEQLVSPVVDGMTNGVRSFLVAWDGSKEGWDTSDAGDEARAEFIAWMRSVAYGDGNSPLDWVEVQYGGDDREAKALAHGDERQEIVT